MINVMCPPGTIHRNRFQCRPNNLLLLVFHDKVDGDAVFYTDGLSTLLSRLYFGKGGNDTFGLFFEQPVRASFFYGTYPTLGIDHKLDIDPACYSHFECIGRILEIVPDVLLYFLVETFLALLLGIIDLTPREYRHIFDDGKRDHYVFLNFFH